MYQDSKMKALAARWFLLPAMLLILFGMSCSKREKGKDYKKVDYKATTITHPLDEGELDFGQNTTANAKIEIQKAATGESPVFAIYYTDVGLAKVEVSLNQPQNNVYKMDLPLDTAWDCPIIDTKYTLTVIGFDNAGEPTNAGVGFTRRKGVQAFNMKYESKAKVNEGGQTRIRHTLMGTNQFTFGLQFNKRVDGAKTKLVIVRTNISAVPKVDILFKKTVQDWGNCNQTFDLPKGVNEVSVLLIRSDNGKLSQKDIDKHTFVVDVK